MGIRTGKRADGLDVPNGGRREEQRPSGTRELTSPRRNYLNIPFQQLSSTTFGTQLMLTLKHAHTQSLNDGLTITVNGQNVAAEVATLLSSDEIKPIKYSQTIFRYPRRA